MAYPAFFGLNFSTPVPVVNGTTYWYAIETDNGGVAGAGAATPDTWIESSTFGSPPNPFGGTDVGPQQVYAVTFSDGGTPFGSLDISAGPVLSFWAPGQAAQPVVANFTGNVIQSLLYITEIFSDTQFAVCLYSDAAATPDSFLGRSDPITVTFVPPPPPFPSPSGGFFVGYPWRFIITDLDSVTTTFAEGLLTNRQIGIVLNDACVITADVWPDDIRINERLPDGYARLAQTNRMIYALRRDNPTGAGGLPPWTCRAAGIIMSPEDEGSVDVPVTHFSAYDAWRYMDALPVYKNIGGLPSETDGLRFIDQPGNDIALAVFNNYLFNSAYAGDASKMHIDAGVANGGTIFWGGTIDVIPNMTVVFQRSSSIGDAWRTLVASGNMDIVLTPIYDPVNRPGYTHDLSILQLAGTVRDDAVFGWDRLNHAVGDMKRMHDATPGMFFNIIQGYAGVGGTAVPLAGPLINGASVADFLDWWQLQFFPGQTGQDPTGDATFALITQALQLAKQGTRTVTLAPIPERSPLPFDKYDIGDRVNVYASARLRTTTDGHLRVNGIPISVDDNGLEHVGALLLSPDWRGDGAGT